MLEEIASDTKLSFSKVYDAIKMCRILGSRRNAGLSLAAISEFSPSREKNWFDLGREGGPG